MLAGLFVALLVVPGAAQAVEAKPVRKVSASATKLHRAKAAKLAVRKALLQTDLDESSGESLALKSAVALVLDQETDEVLFSKNPQAVVPIASITKLMTALVVTEAQQSLDE